VGRGVGWRSIGLLVAVFPEEKCPKPDYAASAGTSSQIDHFGPRHSLGTPAVAHGGQALIAKDAGSIEGVGDSRVREIEAYREQFRGEDA